MLIGKLCLALALPASLFSLFASLAARKDPGLSSNARKACHFVTVLVSVASLVLVYAFVTDSFQLEYVYSYSSRSLPFIYKLTGIWAGLDGSLLFWLWILVICSSIVSFTKKGDEFFNINAVLQAVITFFVLMLVFAADPFKLFAEIPPDGKGLNPLLQNFFMIFHPPALYLGYVGFSVPFAYALARLMEKDISFSRSWFKEIHLWMIASWLFLTIGNVLGAMWAYVELGWGGFWAWDPVENAGILPWFTATAFLHSLTIQERRGFFKTTNLSLVILTFLLTIFGTFITRSGVIKSVHSFSDVTIGLYFITFLVLAVLVSVSLLLLRRKELRAEKPLEFSLSREGAFYLGNVLLIFTMVAILWGTILPLVGQLIHGGTIEVGPEYFNRQMAPLGVLILILMGIGPVMPWGKMNKNIFRKEFLVPFACSIFAGIIAFAFGARKWFPLAISLAAPFVLVVILDEFLGSSKTVAKRMGFGRIRGFFDLFKRAPRRYFGYVVHFGVVLLFIGFAGSAYQKEFSFDLVKGEKGNIAGYDLTFTGLTWDTNKDFESATSTVDVSKNGKLVYQLKPSLVLHKNQPKPSAEVDFHMNFSKDVYLALQGISPDEKESSFVLTINPLIVFVWLGGIIMTVAAAAIIIMQSRRKKKESEVSCETDIDVALGREAT